MEIVPHLIVNNKAFLNAKVLKFLQDFVTFQELAVKNHFAYSINQNNSKSVVKIKSQFSHLILKCVIIAHQNKKRENAIIQ